MDNKKVKLYSRATYSVCGLNGECFVASATASSNTDSIDGQQSNVLAQLESVKSAIIGLNKLKRNQLQGLSKDTTTSSSSSDDGSGTTVTTFAPYGWWEYPMMTNVNDTPGQLCQNDSDGIYYSSDTIHWTLSTGENSQGCSPLSISGTNAIGYYLTGTTLSMIYSTDYGQTWTASSLSLTNVRKAIGTLSGSLGYICVAAYQNTYSWYSTTDGGQTWALNSDYTDSLNSIGSSSSGDNVLWSLSNGQIYYSTNGLSTNSLLGTYSNSTVWVAISGNYGLVAVYNGGVYIVNVTDTTPTLVQCYSTSQAWQGIYISDTPDSSGQISAIVASQKQTIYCSDITATSIDWSVSSGSSIVSAAISGSNAIMCINTEAYLYYSSDYGSTWTST
jgi:hypothetical protein